MIKSTLEHPNAWFQDVPLYNPETDALETVPFSVAACDFEEAGNALMSKIQVLREGSEGELALEKLIEMKAKVDSFVSLKSVVASIQSIHQMQLEGEEDQDGSEIEESPEICDLKDRLTTLETTSSKLESLIQNMNRAWKNAIRKLSFQTKKELSEYFPEVQADFYPKKESFGPGHFEKILDQTVDYFDRDGEECQVTLHQAVMSGFVVISKHLNRMMYHTGDSVLLKRDLIHFEKIKGFLNKVKTAITFIEQDGKGFTTDSSSKLIHSKKDLDEILDRLKNVKSLLETNYFPTAALYLGSLEEDH